MRDQRDRPRRGDHEEREQTDQPRARRGRVRRLVAAVPKVERHDDQERNDRGDQAFGQKSAAGGDPAVDCVTVSSRLEPAEPPEDRHRDGQIEQRVHDREPSDDRLHQRRRQDDGGVDADARAGLARDRVTGERAERDRRQRRRKSQCKGRRAADQREERTQPKIERRLNEVRHAVEVHDYPVVGKQYLASDFAVGRFAVVPERTDAQAGQGDQRRDGRADKGRTGGSVHGTLHLTGRSATRAVFGRRTRNSFSSAYAPNLPAAGRSPSRDRRRRQRRATQSRIARRCRIPDFRRCRADRRSLAQRFDRERQRFRRTQLPKRRSRRRRARRSRRPTTQRRTPA